MTVNGVRLLVREAGSGEPLVLVHGGLDDHRVWEPVEQELAGSFRVITYDRRGHSGSENGPEPGLRSDDEDDLAELIQSLGLAPANVVANSFGASIALGLAARRPELIATLCVHEPPLLDLAADDPAVADVRRSLQAIRERIERGDAEGAVHDFIDNVALGPGAWETMSPEEHAETVAAAGTFAEELRDPGWASLDPAALDPTRFSLLLTRGDESPVFFTTITMRLADTVGAAAPHILPGAGHLPHLTHPADYASTVARFVPARTTGP
ncbi:alpha/beta fold hydrolase [Haloactinopolyspora alba]|uniref:alpha/beta fold hydrolase n=1 Tax=Haloactinopolyspora alba TaxID=648780 RepID=UPI0013EBA658|nr:alpha/beta hydrolase [Haloactinopolyspora alba]